MTLRAGPVHNDTAFRAETPEGIEYTLYPAGIYSRFCAYALDSVFQWLLLAAFMIIYSFALDAVAGMWFVLLVRFALDWFYHVICEQCFRGQTPGKRFLGLRVVESDGSPVSAASSLIRNLLRFVDCHVGLYFISFLAINASGAFRRPGDWAAGTLVIYTWQSQTLRRPVKMDWLSAMAPDIPLALSRPLSFEEKQGILMFARRYPLMGPARADEIAGPLAASLWDKAGSGGPGSDGPDAAPSVFLLGLARTFAGTAPRQAVVPPVVSEFSAENSPEGSPGDSPKSTEETGVERAGAEGAGP